MKQLPQTSKLYHYRQVERPSFWSEEDFGVWSESSLFVLGFPSANRSWSDKYVRFCTLSLKFKIGTLHTILTFQEVFQKGHGSDK